jgi:VanZ family protein
VTPLRRLSLWGPVVLQMALIFYLSSLHDPGPLPGNISDKGGHFLGYALLGALMLRAVAGGRLRAVTWHLALAAVALSALYAASDEAHQSFVAGRSPELLDWVADSMGALAAAAAGYALARLRPGPDGA